MGGDQCNGLADTVETPYHQEERISDVLLENEVYQTSTVCQQILYWDCSAI